MLGLQNRYEALGKVDKAHNEIKEEPLQALLPRSVRPIPRNKASIKTSAKKKQWQGTVTGDSLPSCNQNTHLQTRPSFQGDLLPPWGPNQGCHLKTKEPSTILSLVATPAFLHRY